MRRRSPDDLSAPPPPAEHPKHRGVSHGKPGADNLSRGGGYLGEAGHVAPELPHDELHSEILAGARCQQRAAPGAAPPAHPSRSRQRKPAALAIASVVCSHGRSRSIRPNDRRSGSPVDRPAKVKIDDRRGAIEVFPHQPLDLDIGHPARAEGSHMIETGWALPMA